VKSRERSPGRKQNEPLSFKERLKQSLMEVQKKASEGTLNMDDYTNAHLASNEKPSNLPLNSANPLIALAGGMNVTPQQALLQTMAAMHQKAQELTGVAVPKYYNPAAVNPLKYAEQIKKRKLLWGKKEETATATTGATSGGETPASQSQSTTSCASPTDAAAGSVAMTYTGTSFNQDTDGKTAAKFRKLMGMKEGEVEEGPAPKGESKPGEELMKKQEEMFARLDHEYEFARMATHTHRGIGLGFTSLYGQMPK